MKHFITLLILLARSNSTFNAIAASAYKCRSPDGSIEYKQTPCAGTEGEQTELRVQSAQQNQTQDATDEGIGQCISAIKAKLKDPDSLKVESTVRGNLTPIEYNGTRLLAYQVFLDINAKNSYGAYAGKKMYICYLGQNNQRYLKLEGPY